MRALGTLLIAVALFACQRSPADRPREAPEPYGAAAEGRATSSDGVRVHYRVAGAGSPALVFVHGWCCDASYWDAQLRHFAPRHRVVAVDLAGHGPSGTGRTSWTIPAFASDVRAVVESLDLGPAILVGHSMGGAVILEAARMMPERVIGLVPVDSLHDVASLPTAEAAKPFVDSFRGDFAAATRAMVRRLFPKDADPALVNRVGEDMAQASPAIAVPALEGMFAYDAAGALREIEMPIHAINGDVVPTDLEGNRTLAPQFKATVVPGVGHFPMLEAPERFNRVLGEVVREIAAASGP
ncbi:MAG: alpha/beta fold hydrolase [Acidobacteriota bacterium]